MTGDSQCRAAPASSTKTRKPPPSSASCAGVVNSRKLSINCPVGTATFCNASSDQSSFYVYLFPNDGTGTFTDLNGTFGDCATFWQFLTTGFQFKNIVAYYIPQATQVVSCNNAAGCTYNSTDCLGAWDPVNFVPTGVAAPLPLNGSYYMCAFIDSPAAGGGAGSPALGTPATSFRTALQTVQVTGASLTLSLWQDF